MSNGLQTERRNLHGACAFVCATVCGELGHHGLCALSGSKPDERQAQTSAARSFVQHKRIPLTWMRAVSELFQPVSMQ